MRHIKAQIWGSVLPAHGWVHELYTPELTAAQTAAFQCENKALPLPLELLFANGC